jgi:hypothetical protein
MTEQLKQIVQKYCQVDNELRLLNSQVQEKREVRKMIETEMVGFVSLPAFSDIQKVKVEEDGSYIRIQRPETYSKPWSLPKKDLEHILRMYFEGSLQPNAGECMNFITDHRKTASVAKDFEFTRIVPE